MFVLVLITFSDKITESKGLIKMSRSLLTLFLLILLVILNGCAEGALWKMGRFSPRVRNKWAEEEKIADTLFAKKSRMEQSVAKAVHSSLDEKQRVARELGEIVYRDNVLLTRIHAVRLLGQVDCPAANEILINAAKDFNTDIRIAAIEALQNKSVDVAVPALGNVVGSDTNADVRLAATRALGNFKGDKAVEALALAINDSDPALQLRAAESLRKVTSQPYGKNIEAWQEFVQRSFSPDNGLSDSSDFPSQTADRSDANKFFAR